MITVEDIKILTSLVMSIAFAATASHAEKIITAIPSATLHYLSFYLAKEKRFFKEDNLEDEIITMGGPEGRGSGERQRRLSRRGRQRQAREDPLAHVH